MKTTIVFRWCLLLIPPVVMAQTDFSETQSQMEFQHQIETDHIKSKLHDEGARRRGLETENINRELAEQGHQKASERLAVAAQEQQERELQAWRARRWRSKSTLTQRD
ncbi:MAG TPA: hypothetical protein VK639_07605 [Terriglobales bacterium]|nr:hypothetical protein [Terriglobales bacterium]